MCSDDGVGKGSSKGAAAALLLLLLLLLLYIYIYFFFFFFCGYATLFYGSTPLFKSVPVDFHCLFNMLEHVY